MVLRQLRGHSTDSISPGKPSVENQEEKGFYHSTGQTAHERSKMQFKRQGDIKTIKFYYCSNQQHKLQAITTSKLLILLYQHTFMLLDFGGCTQSDSHIW